MNVLLKLNQTTVTMPKKGHTCCVLGCTVNSKKTVMADGRRPRFFCFPHEKKRPHLRRAWLALTRRPEASTNTRVCEFHFVDGKPSTINPHPILNMGMEATKMQKRAMELRQQKALRKMMLQQQMIAAGQMVPGQELMGLSQEQLQQLEASLAQDQDAGQLPNLDNPLYDDAVKYAASMSLGDGNELPSQIPVSYANSPLPLVMHDRDQSNDGNESMMSNGSLAAELQAEGYDYEDGEDSFNQSDPLSEDLDQITQPSTSNILPEDCSQIAPLNIKSEGPSPIPTDPASEATTPSSNGLVITPVLPSEDNEGLSSADNGQLPSVNTEESGDQKGPLNSNSIISEVMDSITTSTPQKENGPAPQMVQKKAFPIFRNQMSIQQPKQSPPLKIPSWQVRVNGTASVPSALDIPTPPVAKKPRKRKSTPAIKFMLNNKSKINTINTSNSLTVPQVMNSIQTAPKVTNQSGAVMSAQAIESLKSDILENLRAEFLTELQQEVESSKQLKVEMETVRMQTRQELAQMRVELHTLWGENQRLRAQVEGLLQEKEVDFDSINTGN